MSYADEILADSPVLYWKLDEASGFPQDSSGNARHAQETNGTPAYRQPGPFPGSYSINLPVGSRFNYNTGPATTVTDNFTLELWVKLNSNAANGRTLWRNGSTGWEISVDIDGAWFWYSNGNFGADAATFLSSAWRFIHVVRRAGTWEYYVDGNVDTANAGTTAAATPTGGVQLSAAVSLDVHVSNAAIYSNALSAERIAVHYDAAYGVVQTSARFHQMNRRG